MLIIPQNPHLSWSVMTMATCLVVDISSEIGGYFQALDECPNWRLSNKVEKGRRAVIRASLQTVIISFVVMQLAAIAIHNYTRNGMDWRMISVLEGVSRLEAAYNLAFLAIKAPRLLGVYYSKSKERRISYIGGCSSHGDTTTTVSLRELKFHVRYSIFQYFFFVFCTLLPYCGNFGSFLQGLSYGFNFSLLVYVARRSGNSKTQSKIALSMAFLLSFASSILFADGCHYVQTVWGRGWQSEWGLGLLTFVTWSTAMYAIHKYNWLRTEQMVTRNRSFSTHDREERLAISIIFSHAFGSSPSPRGADNATTSTPINNNRRVSGFFDSILGVDYDDDEEEEKEEDEAPVSPSSSRDGHDKDNNKPLLSTWALLKLRLSNPTELVVLSKADLYILYVVSLLSVFVVIVNIGATSQINVVRENYPIVHETLYGSINEGPVCAFKQYGQPVKTFESAKAARRARYKIAHCGACGNCSDSHNMKLQYTTRKYLAKESARCGRMSLLYGRDAVVQCLNDEQRIGFQDQCAECWADDIYCARNHCAFIFLQSTLINTVANFEVGPDTITSATCEEAMCELEFVPCVGANRRRMKINSDIDRPGTQLCDIVDVPDWADLFGEKEDSTSSPGSLGGSSNTDEL